MEEKIFEIVTPEGAIVTVNTEEQNGKYSGDTWSEICQSKLYGKPLLATIKGYQYPKNADMTTGNKPVGYIVNMDENIEAFMPGRLAKRRDFSLECSGNNIVVMVDEFDPLSGDIIIREIPTVGEGSLDLELIKKTLEILGKSEKDGGHLHGVIVGETVHYSTGKRSGYRVSLNGLEAFLPLSETYFVHSKNKSNLIGTGVLVSVLKINPTKMSITLSARKPYDIMLSEKILPKINRKSIGLVSQVNESSIYILMPGNVLGKIKRQMYPNYDYQYWLSFTGKIIEIVPFKKEKWNEDIDDLRLLVHPVFNEKENYETV